MSDADELVRRYIMRTFRADGANVLYPEGRNAHLADCADAYVAAAETNVARFWDTGVTGVQFSASIKCPHGERQEYEFGDLGDLSDILADMERDERGEYGS